MIQFIGEISLVFIFKKSSLFITGAEAADFFGVKWLTFFFLSSVKRESSASIFFSHQILPLFPQWH